MTHDYSAYIGHNKSPDDLSEVAKLAEKQYAAQQKVENLAAQLDEAKKELKQIAEYELPEKMEEVGLSEYKTTTGIEVLIREDIRGTLPAENRPKGHKWLEDNGYASLIKSKVVADFGRDEIEQAYELVERLRSENRLSAVERKVEASTLSAFIRELLAEGKEIPLDVFSVYRQRVAKVGI